jgi:hypothetical protein
MRSAPPGSRLTGAPADFLGDVLAHPEFQRDGVAVGRARQRGLFVHWAVVDPSRHDLFAWRKASHSFVEGARDLDASLVTNGPFTNYAGGDLLRSTVKVALDTTLGAVSRPALIAQAFQGAAQRRYQARAPLGFVRGRHESISETTVSRPRLHYFGRRDGTGFVHYEIAQGDPGHEMVEVVGGLFRCVTDHQRYTVRQHIQVGYWGLAPLDDNRVVPAAALAAPRERYASRAPTGDPGGLLVFLGGWGSTQRLSALLVAIGVKDAVQIDGGDSLLLRDADRLRVGRHMPFWKRNLQCWGLCLRPACAVDG